MNKEQWEKEFRKEFVKDLGPKIEPVWKDPNGCVGPVIASISKTRADDKERMVKIIKKRIAYGKRFRLKNKDALRSGWSGIESGSCCDKCAMRDEHFNGRADALKAIVGCRNPFQLKEDYGGKKLCQCHLSYRKVAEESIQEALKNILRQLVEAD